MQVCQHKWEMANVEFGYLVFEKCGHCSKLRTHFSEDSTPVLGERHREGDCYWNRLENAPSVRFDLRCASCGHLEELGELMGFLHCTGCMRNCEVEKIRIELEREKTWIMVAFGFLPRDEKEPPPAEKLDVLTEYFNQRRDTSRSRMRIVSFDLIRDLTRCKGDFIHEVGMMSPEELQQM